MPPVPPTFVHSAPAPTQPWRLCIETGGTFTDCVAIGPDGAARRAKVLSSGTLRLAARITSVLSSVAPGEGQALVARVLSPLPEGAHLTSFAATDSTSGVQFTIASHTLEQSGAAAPGPREHTVVLSASRSPANATPHSSYAAGTVLLLECATGETAPIVAARLVTGTAAGGQLPNAAVRFATTRGTNALLERRVTPVALFVTRGFRDLLEIGDQRRPDLFALDIRKHAPLTAAVVEVGGRLDRSGREIAPLELEAAAASARELVSRGIRAAAVALMHSWANPAHELALAAVLASVGFTHISVSSQLAPRIKIVPRARTAAVNAALSGPIEEFVARTVSAWDHASAGLEIMTSSGGLVPVSRFAPKDSLLSGPAAGVRGAAHIGTLEACPRVIAFDMGGTSTDVTRIDTEPELTPTHKVEHIELMAPALPVHSVAAGGGSICDLEIVDTLARPTVGPRSAGADPGPACYGRGGPLTITDVNLLLGRLDARRFQIPISPESAHRALRELIARARAAGAAVEPESSLLASFLAIANQRMSSAIRAISVRKGYDPASYALVAFGGAGGQHACAIAGDLGIRTILCPADASLLSAAGLLVAEREAVRERQVLRDLDSIAGELPNLFGTLSIEARAALDAPAASIRAGASLRFRGQDHTLDIPWSAGDAADMLQERFISRSREVFGYTLRDRPIEVESIRVVATGARPTLPPRAAAPAASRSELPPSPTGDGGPVIEREKLAHPVSGPALIVDHDTTVVVEPGWVAEKSHHGTLRLSRESPFAEPPPFAPAQQSGPHARARSPSLTRELLAGRLESLGEALGELLGRTAISTNVKERLDYSCALLDADAELVISAPHIPVHLGALGVCVRTLRRHITMNPGDVIITNHPAFGGSHLPDVTLVAPAHDAEGALIGYTACRAHHAEIGGSRPGSMPPDAARLDQEGVIIAPTHVVVAGGEPRWDELRTLLESAPFPSRSPAENLADLAAQLAALRLGVRGMRELAQDPGLRDAMSALKARAESAARRAIKPLGDIAVSADATLDDGSIVAVTIRSLPAIAEKKRAQDSVPAPLPPLLSIDFAGTSLRHPGNLNAPAGVVHSAVMYVVRLLVGDSAGAVPLNDGLLRPIDLRLPECFINPPWESLAASGAPLPAVAGGNVETSQQIVNLLLRALGLSAESQGTMNNLLFGSARLGYYETIGGGAGATPRGPGASGLHTHMTNTAITDPEILELRYPVRLDRFAIRTGSGGREPTPNPSANSHQHTTVHPGGDGLIREITFLEPLSVSLLTSNRHAGPRGLNAPDGQPGAQWVRQAEGTTVQLRAIDGFEAAPGDQLIIHTPGGGAARGSRTHS